MRASIISLFLLTAPLCAQLDRGTVTGSVTDSSGAMVPNAAVTITASASNAAYKTKTSADGQYTMPNLPIGRYALQVDANGFKKYMRTGIELGVTQVLRVDAVIEVGSASESISVTTEVSKLQTDTPEVATALSHKELVALPISISTGSGARQAEFFAYKLAPGAYGNTTFSYIAGGTAASKDSLVNGATASTARGGQFTESSVSAEALQEFKIQTNGISAEFGRFQTAVFNYVMKSGNNEIHGSAFGAVKNEVLNANTFSNKAFGLPRGRERRFNYAGSFGGPVYIPKIYNGRNKTFFYVAYERYFDKSLTFASPNITLPLTEFYDGNFSRLLGGVSSFTDALGRPVLKGAIYDPATFRKADNGQWVGDMFLGNVIPASRISAVSRNLNAIAKPNYIPTVRDSTGQVVLANNALYPSASTLQLNQYNFSVKGDQIVNDRHKISAAYSYTDRPRQSSSMGMWDARDLNGGILSLANTNISRTPALARLAEDWMISPTILNHVMVYYNRTTFTNGPPPERAAIDGAAELGIKNLHSIGYPVVNWGSGPAVTLASAGNYVASFSANSVYGLMDTLNFSHGRHFMKAGFEARRYQIGISGDSATTFNFSPLGTAIPGASYSGSTIGYSFASYLLGIVHSADKTDPVGTGGIRNYLAGFIQDDFKVNRKLTLSLGLRWDYNAPTYEIADRYSSWSPVEIDPVSGLPGAYQFAGNCSVCTGSRSFGTRDFSDFGPRIGFAWQAPFRLVVRGGYGILYEGDNFNSSSGTPLGKPTQTAWGGTYQLNADAVQPWAGTFNWDSGFPTNRYYPAAYDRSWGNKNVPGMVNPAYGRSPRIQNWNVNVQREVIRNLIVDVGYVGNKGNGLRDGQLAVLNQLPASALSQYGTKLLNPIKSAADAAALGVKYPFPGFQGTLASALREFPQIQGNSTISNYSAPLAFSTFNSLQVSANWRFSKGLTAYGNYVWSKGLTNVLTSDITGNSGPLDYYNLKLEKAINRQDVPSALKAFISYEVPVGRGKTLLSGSNRVVNGFIGGWSISAILNYLSGLPTGFSAPSPLAGGWNGSINRANIADGPMTLETFDASQFNLRAPDSMSNRLLNRAVYSLPAPLTLGTSAPAYAQVRGFPTLNEDIALEKRFQVNEKYRFQLRIDMLNAFNRHTLSGLNTNIQSTSFGQVSNVSGNRSIMAALRMDF